MKAVILSIGSELTSGQSVDTNSAWLARRLGELGIETACHETLADDRAAIAGAIRRAAGLAEVVVISGGLGPTPDDVTRDALAEAMGVELAMDAASLAEIEAYFASRDRTMKPNNRVQAMVPTGAEPLPNACGTACGLAAELDGARVFVTPGVPQEMRRMFDEQIAPRLPAGRGAVLHEVVRLFGTGESDFALMLDGLMHRQGPVVVGTTVAAGLVSVRITSTASDAATAGGQIDEMVEQVRRRCGSRVLGVGESASMASAVGELLKRCGRTLATAESCTGGRIGEMLTAVPGSSDYYLGGVVAYANDVKAGLLEVPRELLDQHGAVSEPVARALAEGVRGKLGADYAVSTTGIAGPGGGTAEKPVGLVFTALAGPGGTAVARHFLPGDRDRVRLRASLAALDALRLELLEE